MALLLRLALGMIWTIGATAFCAAQSLPAIFQAYPAEPAYEGPAAPPDLSPPAVHAYRTRVREAAALPANFNGHDRLIIWGCGTTCFTGAVLDKRTGQVVLFPFFICCGAGPSTDDPDPILFQDDSSLIIFRGLRNGEPPDGDHYYRFANDTFTFLKTVPAAAAAGAPSSAPAPSQAAEGPPVKSAAAAKPTTKDTAAKACRAIDDSEKRLACFDKAFKISVPRPERSAVVAPKAPVAPAAPPPLPALAAAQVLATPSLLTGSSPAPEAPAPEAPPAGAPSMVDTYKKEINPLLQSMSLARIAMSCGFRSDDYYKFFLVAFDQKRQSLVKRLHMPAGVIPGMAEEVKRVDEAIVKRHPCASLSQSKELKALDKLKSSLAHAPH